MTSTVRYREGIKLTYDNTIKINTSSLTPKKDRAVLSHITADIILPDDSVLTVEMDFDSKSGYHNNAMIIMDDLGAELLADAMTYRYGEAAGEQVRQQWQTKRTETSPRKPTFLFVKNIPKNKQKVHSRDNDEKTTPIHSMNQHHIAKKLNNPCNTVVPHVFAACGDQRHNPDSPYVFAACGDQGHNPDSPYVFAACGDQGHDTNSPYVFAACGDQRHNPDSPYIFASCGDEDHNSRSPYIFNSNRDYLKNRYGQAVVKERQKSPDLDQFSACTQSNDTAHSYNKFVTDSTLLAKAKINQIHHQLTAEKQQKKITNEGREEKTYVDHIALLGEN